MAKPWSDVESEVYEAVPDADYIASESGERIIGSESLHGIIGRGDTRRTTFESARQHPFIIAYFAMRS